MPPCPLEALSLCSHSPTHAVDSDWSQEGHQQFSSPCSSGDFVSLQRQGLREQGPPGGRRDGSEGRGEACQQGGNAPPNRSLRQVRLRAPAQGTSLNGPSRLNLTPPPFPSTCHRAVRHGTTPAPTLTRIPREEGNLLAPVLFSQAVSALKLPRVYPPPENLH